MVFSRAAFYKQSTLFFFIQIGRWYIPGNFRSTTKVYIPFSSPCYDVRGYEMYLLIRDYRFDKVVLPFLSICKLILWIRNIHLQQIFMNFIKISGSRQSLETWRRCKQCPKKPHYAAKIIKDENSK